MGRSPVRVAAMNNTVVTAISAGLLYLLDQTHASPWLAAPFALAIGFTVAWCWTRRADYER